MKEFKDLEFKPHITGEGKQAVMFFENGYGISVIRFKVGILFASYTSNDSEWEAAVLIGNRDNSDICYTSGITEDVIGHLSDEDVSELMVKIQSLPSIY